jgi:hypothetical protein
MRRRKSMTGAPKIEGAEHRLGRRRVDARVVAARIEAGDIGAPPDDRLWLYP